MAKHRVRYGPACLLAATAGCQRPQTPSWQGYIEGDFVYVASPLAGRLEKLSAPRGTRLTNGAPLFALEATAESASQREASARTSQARARMEDLRKGQRPEEIAAMTARLEQARAMARLSETHLDRVTRLKASGAAADDDFDRARFSHEAGARLVAEIEAQLSVARLGARVDTIAAAESDVAAADAALERANWAVAQKTQNAPTAAVVYDHLYLEGEYVPAGAPVVSLLPPGNIRVRFFVPDASFSSLAAGASVRVRISGRPEPLPARITYLSPKPEYTPPVLYNRENRSKLLFMVEATPEDRPSGGELHPGQPVDVFR